MGTVLFIFNILIVATDKWRAAKNRLIHEKYEGSTVPP